MIRFAIAALGVALLSGTSAMAADLVVNEPVADVAVPNGFYATFFAGGSFASGETTFQPDVGPGIVFDTDLDGGFIVGGAIGTTLHQNLRGEIEFSYIQADVGSILNGIPVPDGVSVTSTGYNLLANLWYDFSNDSGFTPYVGAGVGYGHTVVSGDLPADITASGLLYQLGAGVKFDVAENIALDLGYRYRVLSDADTESDGMAPPAGGSVTTDAVNHIVQAGVTFGF